MLVVVGEAVSPFGDAEQHAEGVVLVTDRHGEQRRRGHRLGEEGEEVFLGLAGERDHHRPAAGDDGAERGLANADGPGEDRFAQFALLAAQDQDVVDQLVKGAGSGTQQPAGMAGKVERDAGFIALAGEALRRTHQGFELRGFGTELAKEPDPADGLGGLVGQQGKERHILFTEGIEPVGITVHDADHVPHQLHRDRQLGPDALTDFDVARIPGDIRNTKRLGVERHPTCDPLALIDDSLGRVLV